MKGHRQIVSGESTRATFRDVLAEGAVIPASPMALTADRKLDQRRQRALWRYYSAAGAGGIAVGVHTTQFEIRDPQFALLRPVLELAGDEMDSLDRARTAPLVRIAGACGKTAQAVTEASLARELGYHAVLLSLAAMKGADDRALIKHCRAIADVIPLVGFYLQPAVGGRVLPYGFWRRFAEIDAVVAIKIAAFNRYWTIDVARAVAEAGREDIALYSGNDDNIVMDLLTPYLFEAGGRLVERRMVGGLLGHWSFWTAKAVELLQQCHAIIGAGSGVPDEMLRRSVEVTDANAAVFDVANNFAGCIPGVHEVLRRQGLLSGTWCLDTASSLGSGQGEQIDRVCRAYPHLNDDSFVADHLEEWLTP